MVKKKNRKKPKPVPRPLVVGPSYIQVLTGSFLGKEDVTLILCGESHEDAIDVTRQGGIFEPKEGWVERTSATACLAVAYRILATTPKPLPIGKCLEWGKKRIEDDEYIYTQVLLVWVHQQGQQAKAPKGKGYLLEFSRDLEDIDDDDDDDKEEWVPIDPLQETIFGNGAVNGASERIFEWSDLDARAHDINVRRLSDEEVSTQELDAIINERKVKLKASSNIWTWDDWFMHVQSVTNRDSTDVHLLLEGPIPPWEVQLHRPTSLQDIPPAPDYLRCIPEDEETDDDEEGDPSNDGIGSYMDYLYRKFMDVFLVAEAKKDKNWFHCVDNRDLGCETACHTDAVKKRWKQLLHDDEIELLNGSSGGFQSPDFNEDKTRVKFLDAKRMNPEQRELEELHSSDKLMADDDSENEDDEDGFTLPSFEGFFGQASDSLYYSPHVRLAYSPFLAKCVGSLSNWELFFTKLFFGGTVQDALSTLKLAKCEGAVHVRSLIAKSWNTTTGSFEYKRRGCSEHYVTYPFFPYLYFLTAANDGAEQEERTWSSEMFAKLCNPQTEETVKSVREWVLENIYRQSGDPKGTDDAYCGGEWFESYLRAAHRDIYDDIDRTDCSVLLREQFMRSESDGRKKYDIGSITVPNANEAFAAISERFAMESELPSDQLINPRIECMAKILIDIWMSNLVDFSTILKVVEVVSDAKNNRVVVVCYLGSAHTRAVSDFFVNRMAFKRKAFIGKLDWDENEPRTLDLPPFLWQGL